MLDQWLTLLVIAKCRQSPQAAYMCMIMVTVVMAGCSNRLPYDRKAKQVLTIRFGCCEICCTFSKAGLSLNIPNRLEGEKQVGDRYVQ